MPPVFLCQLVFLVATEGHEHPGLDEPGDHAENLEGGEARGGYDRVDAPFRIAQGPVQNGIHIFSVQGVQLEYPRPGDQGRDHIEIGVFRRGADQYDLAGLHVRQ